MHAVVYTVVNKCKAIDLQKTNFAPINTIIIIIIIIIIITSRQEIRGGYSPRE